MSLLWDHYHVNYQLSNGPTISTRSLQDNITDSLPVYKIILLTRLEIILCANIIPVRFPLYQIYSWPVKL